MSTTPAVRSASAHRRTLAEFLKAKRGLVSPAAHGFPVSRRRTPGLRREEIAQLCRISATWYTWIEQGRDVTVSAGVLVRLAEVLKLSAAERAYLFELCGKKDPHQKTARMTAIPSSLRAVVDAIRTPAYVLERHYEPVAWNRAAALHFGAWLGKPRPESLLEYMFLDPGAREFVVDWPARARRLVAEFRADVSAHLEEVSVGRLLARLSEHSAEFRRCWRLHDVVEREGGVRAFDHPRKGRVRFEQVNLWLAHHPDVKLVVLAPVSGRPR